LKCRNCGAVFAYSQISETLADFFLPPKPALPPEGLDCECPDCKITHRYQQDELKYQAE
jgi:hypothetical protein